MAGTTLTDLSAITLTANAKAYASARGVDINSMLALAKSHSLEFTTLLKNIVAAHPSGGGDAANLAALNTIIAELA